QPAQAHIDDPADHRKHGEQMEKWHALQERERLLGPRQDEDEQRTDAGDGEQCGTTIAKLGPNAVMMCVMRERVAGWLHKAGALGAVMELRRLTPVPLLSIVTYHHIADQDESYPYDPNVADAN